MARWLVENFVLSRYNHRYTNIDIISIYKLVDVGISSNLIG